MIAVVPAGSLPKVATLRSAYWDAWKGVAILAVVTIHAGAVALGFPADSPNAQFGLMLRQGVNFAVPLFLAMAGYFAVGDGAEAVAPSWRQRAARLLPPYLFWTLVTVALRRPWHFQSWPLLLVVKPGAPFDEAAIARAVRGYVGEGLRIRVERVTQVPRTANGKLRVVVRNL